MYWKRIGAALVLLAMGISIALYAKKDAGQQNMVQTMQGQLNSNEEEGAIDEKPENLEEEKTTELGKEQKESVNQQEELAEDSAKEREEETAEDSVKGREEETAEDSIKEVDEEAVKDSAKETEKETTEDTAKEAKEESTKKTDQEPAEDSLKGTEKESTKNAEEVKEYTGSVQKFEPSKICYATLILNVRTGPGTGYDAVGALQPMQEVEVLGIAENGWYQISFQGEEHYSSSKYLVDTREEALAAVAPKPEAQPQEIEVTQPAQSPEVAVTQPTQSPAVTQPAPPPAVTVPKPEAQPQEAAAAQPAPVTAKGGIIFIGDSRCVQMQEAVQGGGCSWICENSKGYDWLSETAIGWADPSVGEGTKVVFCLGVNDPENVRNYAELVNAKAAEWAGRGAVVYYVSVNPVWENPYVTKEEVERFNATMPGLLSGVTWIDTYSWLMENGCRIVDGLHYDAPTSANIFNLIMGSL